MKVVIRVRWEGIEYIVTGYIQRKRSVRVFGKVERRREERRERERMRKLREKREREEIERESGD